jgi:hypothetical protein
VQTTLPFHAWLLAHPEFTEGRVRTDLVARDWEPEALRLDAATRAAAAVARHVWEGAAGAVPPPAGAVAPSSADAGRGWKPEPWS